MIRPVAIRCGPFRPGSNPSCIFSRAGWSCPIRASGIIDVTAPLPEHMKKSFAMFGFDVTDRDPIEDAPDE